LINNHGVFTRTPNGEIMENLLTSAILGSFYRFFYQNLPVNQCWEWFGYRDKDNYGMLKVKGKDYRAHRISYCLFHNIPNTKLLVLHICNNPSCVNPHHLEGNISQRELGIKYGISHTLVGYIIRREIWKHI
jgi:hypothetical protein